MVIHPDWFSSGDQPTQSAIPESSRIRPITNRHFSFQVCLTHSACLDGFGPTIRRLLPWVFSSFRFAERQI
jgi:hypothetical protein